MTSPQRSLLDALEPINPRTQVERVPGLDAACPHQRKDDCRWPYCRCYSPDRTPEQGDT